MKKWLCLLLVLSFLPSAASAAALQTGSSGKQVAELQSRLIELSLLSGKADGIYGAQTASAVETAQWLLQTAGYSIMPDGIAGETTLALLFIESAEAALRTVRKGSRGERVKALQNRLIDLGLLTGAADGVFGSRTEKAVVAFQEQMQLDQPDGVVSPALYKLIESDVSGAFPHAPVYFDESDPLSLTAASLYAPSCILIDAPSGEVLLERNADERRYPASTTKILTLLLALEYGNLDDVITIPQSAADIPADSSLTPVYPGEQMTMRDLLYGLMIRSGNDAANAVSELCAGSVEAFVNEMNALAAELGMQDSHFVNPHGYHHEEHYTTARDLSIAAREGLTDPVFCEIVTCMSYTLPATGRREPLVIQNIWELFDPASEYYIPGAAGVKSGYTSAAGFCYVGAAQREGRTLIAVVLGEPTRNRAWIDLSRLFEYGFAL